MRTNLPVSDVEHELGEGDSIISQTDLRGRIVFVNNEFCAISGYARAELIGQPHNLIRHPRMPEAVFADLWATLKAGKSWKGILCNRCRNGDSYWVLANVHPIYRDDAVTGYMSLRTRPPAADLALARRVYAQMREPATAGRWVIERGRPRRAGWRGIPARLRRLRLRQRLVLLVLSLALLNMTGAAFVLDGITRSSRALTSTQHAQARHADTLNTITRKMMENRIMLLDAAAAPLAHPAEALRQQVRERQAQIDRLLAGWRAGANDAGERALFHEWDAARLAYKAQVDDATEALMTGDLASAREHAGAALSDRYTALLARIDAIARQRSESSASAVTSAEAAFRSWQALALAFLAGSALLALWLLASAQRSIIPPLRAARRLASAISAGDLSGQVEVVRDDEIGEMVQSTLNIRGNLRGLTRDVLAAGGEVATSAQAMSALAERLGRALIDQEHGIDRAGEHGIALRREVAASVEHAEFAHHAATRTAERVIEASANLTTARDAVEEFARASQRLHDIVSVMNGVAMQTDILAINTAERAERDGGGAGGFGTVAKDVHFLARRSSDAASTARRLTDDIEARLARSRAALGECADTLDALRTDALGVIDAMHTSMQAAQAHTASADALDRELARLRTLARTSAEHANVAIAATSRIGSEIAALEQRMHFFRMPTPTTATTRLAQEPTLDPGTLEPDRPS